jgi:hypothetical protein
MNQPAAVEDVVLETNTQLGVLPWVAKLCNSTFLFLDFFPPNRLADETKFC